MDGSVTPLTLQFLAWVAERPRSHAELMDSWKGSCPRLTVWEDAIAAGPRSRGGKQAIDRH